MMNLIVTCARHLEGETGDELGDILDELGDSDVKISVSSMSGIITAQTKLDPIEVVKKMREMLLDELLIVDGMPGCGKSLFCSIFSSLERGCTCAQFNNENKLIHSKASAE